ncbi:MAG: polysaccharide deacetylase family protein [Candidatus Thorarchaeota archaeon]
MTESKNICVVLIFTLLIQSVLILGISNNAQVDLPTVEIFRGGKQYAFMFSWDDGGNDLRFSFLEDNLGFKHTTFAVTSRIQTKSLWGLDMLFRGHDIQSHSRLHLHHAQLNESYRDYLFTQSVKDIEDVYGYTPILLAYPYGSHDSVCQSQVLKYFRVARGISSESTSKLGTWPITNPGCCVQSFPCIDGVVGHSYGKLVDSFNTMVKNSGDRYTAYKCYGHSGTSWFSEEERNDLFSKLRDIAFRNDTWYTSWGEAIAYQIQRENIHIYNLIQVPRYLSFNTNLAEEFNYGIPMTFRIQIPSSWTEVSVLDGGRIVGTPVQFSDNGERFILLDSVPRNQKILVCPIKEVDTDIPEISHMRIQASHEGVAFLSDILDRDGFVSDVDITIVGNNQTFEFHTVVNPIFWNNNTYGRVVFDIQPGWYKFIVTATDEFLNKATKQSWFYIASEIERASLDSPD